MPPELRSRSLGGMGMRWGWDYGTDGTNGTYDRLRLVSFVLCVLFVPYLPSQFRLSGASRFQSILRHFFGDDAIEAINGLMSTARKAHDRRDTLFSFSSFDQSTQCA